MKSDLFYFTHSVANFSISLLGIVSALAASGYFAFILSNAHVQIVFIFSSFSGLQFFIKASITVGSVQLTGVAHAEIDKRVSKSEKITYHKI
jgi:hypothetical protein